MYLTFKFLCRSQIKPKKTHFSSFFGIVTNLFSINLFFCLLEWQWSWRRIWWKSKWASRRQSLLQQYRQHAGHSTAPEVDTTGLRAGLEDYGRNQTKSCCWSNFRCTSSDIKRRRIEDARIQENTSGYDLPDFVNDSSQLCYLECHFSHLLLRV